MVPGSVDFCDVEAGTDAVKETATVGRRLERV
jgi:hypothetical protein